jgi:hypothetical protein
MNWFYAGLLFTAFFFGCNKSAPAPQPPISIEAVEASVKSQLTERFPEHTLKINQVDVHADLSFTLHVSTTFEGKEVVHPMKLTSYMDEKNPQRIYSGQIPISLFGEESSEGKTFFQVYIDAPGPE